jgi:hypothetical protein
MVNSTIKKQMYNLKWKDSEPTQVTIMCIFITLKSVIGLMPSYQAITRGSPLFRLFLLAWCLRIKLTLEVALYFVYFYHMCNFLTKSIRTNQYRSLIRTCMYILTMKENFTLKCLYRRIRTIIDPYLNMTVNISQRNGK